MQERVNQVPQDHFVAACNGSVNLAEAVRRLSELVGKPVPGWAVLSRAGGLKRTGVEVSVPGPRPKPSENRARATD